MTEQAIFELSTNIANQIRKHNIPEMKIGIVLGSGLGDFAKSLTDQIVVDIKTLEGYPAATVAGHSGKIIFGKSGSVSIVAFQGRIHHYEGRHIKLTTLPIWIMKQLGVEQLILTNAAGGLNPNFNVGDLMVIVDHINLLWKNPLIGKSDPKIGPRFPDMSEAYNKRLTETAFTAAKELGLTLQKGIYCAVTGPSYETPAEIKMFQKIGADAVGMSTVGENIQAVQLGLKVLGISCITNMAAGITGEKLSHEEVTVAGNMVKEKFANLVHKIIQLI